jgi:putative endonuclease
MNNILSERSKNREKGQKGEEIACMFLVKHGFRVVTRNYLKKCGEIDIVAKKDNIIHFIEVKTRFSDVLGTSSNTVNVNPIENISQFKIVRLKRAIGLYFIEYKLDPEVEFVVDGISVILDQERRLGRVHLLSNII